MGLTYEQWKDEIKELDEEQIKRISEAITELMNWDTFREEFEWTGLTAIRAMCDFHS